MEEQLECPELMSLEEMASRKVTVHLLNFSDILAFILKFKHNTCEIAEFEKEWQKIIEPVIKDKVPALNLPDLLAKQIIEKVKPIGLHIKRWTDRQDNHFRNETQQIILPRQSKLCWTKAGSIDYRKTAKGLVCWNALDVVLRYKLACINCLEDDIPLLWEELPEEKKLYFCSMVSDLKPVSPHLEFCWPYILKGELSKLDYVWRTRDPRNLTSFNHWAFEESALKGNEVATQYFFQKLTQGEIESSLTRTGVAVHQKLSELSKFSSDELAEVFFYLLSVMTPEQGMEVFRSEESSILVYFLRLPWRDIFLENLRLFWRFIPSGSYLGLEYEMRYVFERSDLNFRKVFPEFFKQSPLDFKRHLINRGFTCRFLSMFFETEDSECIEAIFGNVDTADTVKLVFHPRVLKLFFDSILEGRWHMLQVFLRKASLSEKDKKRLGEAFTGVLEGLENGESVKRKFERYFEFLDEATARAYKEKKAKRRKLEYSSPE